MARLRPSLYFGTTLTLLAGACSDPLEPEDLAGTYTATTLTVDLPAGQTVDVLALGASITVELEADGTTTGRIVLPAIPGFSSQPLDETLEGTYTVVNRDRVRFTHAADTILRDLVFVADGRELRASYEFLDSQNRQGTLRVTLTRGG